MAEFREQLTRDGHVKPGDLKGLSVICHNEQHFLSGSSFFFFFF